MNVSDSHTTLGTPLYCAPEILEGKRYNSKADVWSLGCIFYEMLYGRAPFNPANIPNLVKQAKKGLSKFPQEVEVDENVLNLLKGMLQPDKVKRSRWDQIFAHSYFTEYEPSIILTQINPTDSQFIYVDLQRNCLEQRLTQIVKNFRFWKEINEYLTKVAREAYQVMHYLKISSKNQILLMLSSAMMVLQISSNFKRLISEKPLSFEIDISIEDIQLLMKDRTKYTENLNWINYQFYIMANYIKDLKQKTPQLGKKFQPETVQLISELLKGTKLDTKIVENIQMSIKQCVMELQNKISPSQGQSPLLIVIEKCITVYYIPCICFNLEQTLEILHYLQLKQMPNTNMACLSKTQNNEYKLIVA